VAFDILLALMLSACGAKGSVMTAKQTPYMRPCINAKLIIVHQNKFRFQKKKLLLLPNDHTFP